MEKRLANDFLERLEEVEESFRTEIKDLRRFSRSRRWPGSSEEASIRFCNCDMEEGGSDRLGGCGATGAVEGKGFWTL